MSTRWPKFTAWLVGRDESKEKLAPTGNRCSRCGTPTYHVCSWVCVDMCPKCDVLGGPK